MTNTLSRLLSKYFCDIESITSQAFCDLEPITSQVFLWPWCFLSKYFYDHDVFFIYLQALREAHDQFKASLSAAQADFNQLAALDKQIKGFNVGPNPYTWFTMDALEETWKNLQKIIKVWGNANMAQKYFLKKITFKFGTSVAGVWGSDWVSHCQSIVMAYDDLFLKFFVL